MVECESGTAEQESMGSVMRNESETVKKHALNDLLKAWGEWIEAQGFAAGSVTDHRQKLQRFLDFLNGADPLEVDREQAAAYQSYLFELVSKKTRRKLACNSQINRLSVLKNFYRFLHQTGRIAINPTSVIVLPRSPKLLPPVLLKPREMRRLLDAPDLQNPMGFRDRVIMEVFYATGMRLAELISLAVDDLNFEERLITIRKGKGGKMRIVPMGEVTSNWLSEYLQNVRPVLLKRSESSFVFLNRFGRAMNRSGWQKKLPLYLRQARIKRVFTSHCFRHQLATSMLERGADIRHIQEILGHETLKTTQRYLQVVKAELKRIHKRSHPRERHYVKTTKA